MAKKTAKKDVEKPVEAPAVESAPDTVGVGTKEPEFDPMKTIHPCDRRRPVPASMPMPKKPCGGGRECDRKANLKANSRAV